MVVGRESGGKEREREKLWLHCLRDITLYMGSLSL